MLYSEVVNQTKYAYNFFFLFHLDLKLNRGFFLFLISCTTAQDTLYCLRSVDVNSLENANLKINNSGFYGTFVFVPVVDGGFITERPSLLLREGKVNIDRVSRPICLFFLPEKIQLFV